MNLEEYELSLRFANLALESFKGNELWQIEQANCMNLVGMSYGKLNKPWEASKYYD
jgi:hypothetical protein